MIIAFQAKTGIYAFKHLSDHDTIRWKMWPLKRHLQKQD